MKFKLVKDGRDVHKVKDIENVVEYIVCRINWTKEWTRDTIGLLF